jgi:putative DNA primase/helicase
MTIQAAMQDACAAVGIKPPRRVVPGQWCQTPVEGKAASNTSGRVLVDADGRHGVAYNWATGQHVRFTVAGPTAAPAVRDRAAEAARAEADAERSRIVADACARIVAAAAPAPHPYLAAKGFPDELGLVLPDPRPHLPRGDLGQAMARALPEGDGPMLIIPGRIGQRVATVQFITPEGVKKNALGGAMSGAAHRIATGRQTVVCEGIATALSVRAALRLLGVRATVLCAFSAANVAKVAKASPGALILADHDRPIEHLNGLGTGEFYARNTGLRWAMPPEPGDYNDWHQRDGLRAVALHLRGVLAG